MLVVIQLEKFIALSPTQYFFVEQEIPIPE